VLVRHGRTTARNAGWLDSAGVAAWLDDYAHAGLAENDVPPESLRVLAASAGIVVASDLPRARASAERLVVADAVVVSKLLRETPLLIPALGALRLPFLGWGLAISAFDGLNRMRGTAPDTEVVNAGVVAAEWLVSLADSHRDVLAVTHVNVRTHIATALMQKGWSRVPGGSKWAPWSAWTFSRAN